MKSNFKKKTYYVITHPDLPGYYVENFGDRDFIMHFPNYRVTESSAVSLRGDVRWDITEANIHAGADFCLEEKLKELSEKKAAEEKKKPKPKPVSRFKSYQCQDCGESIGWIGRFFTEPIFGKVLKHKSDCGVKK